MLLKRSLVRRKFLGWCERGMLINVSWGIRSFLLLFSKKSRGLNLAERQGSFLYIIVRARTCV